MWEMSDSQPFRQQYCSYHDLDMDVSHKAALVGHVGVCKWGVGRVEPKVPLNLTSGQQTVLLLTTSSYLTTLMLCWLLFLRHFQVSHDVSCHL